MYYLLLVAAIVSVAQCSPVKPLLVLSPRLITLVTEKTAICQVESNADPFILKNLLPWNIKESETNGKFLYCLMRELDFEGKDGHLVVDKFMEVFDESFKLNYKNELRDLLTQCNEEVGKNQYFTIFKIANCFHTKSPVRMSL